MKPRARWGAAAGVLLVLALIAFRPDEPPTDRSTAPQTPFRRDSVTAPMPGFGPGRFVTAASNIYLVQPGDTLSLIAARFRVTETDLQTLNHLADAQSLYAGQHLLIPQSSAN